MKRIIMLLVAAIVFNFNVEAATKKNCGKKATIVKIQRKGVKMATKSISVPDSVIEALIQVETHGDNTKVGKLGEIGILQILPGVIKDVNDLVLRKKTYVIEDALDNEKAKEVCKLYLGYWGAQLEKNEHRKATEKDLARIWNGGPTGYLKMATKDYYAKYVKEKSKLSRRA